MNELCDPGTHEWSVITFSFSSFIECDRCGVRPVTEREFDYMNGVCA